MNISNFSSPRNFGFLVLIYFLLTIHLSVADVKFPKDQGMKHRWPPLILKHESGKIPDGHLRPFGYQKKSEGKAKEFQGPLTAEDFHSSCVRKKIPCLFQDVMNGTDPMKKWDDKTVETSFGKLNVSVERFLADKSKEKSKVSMRHFIRNYHHKEMFIRSTVLKEMEDAVPMLSMINCGTIGDSITEVVLWASSGFTPSRLHYDSESQLHCLLDGRKDFVLYDPKYASVFKLKETYKGSGVGFCPWNPEILSVYENPKLSTTPWRYATLWPGDCLYVPQGHLHQVRAHGRSWSLSYHWIHSDSANFDNCAEKRESDIRLSEANVFWTYEEGDKRIRQDIISAKNLRIYLSKLAKQSDEITYDKFYNFVVEANENFRDFDDGDIDDPSQVIDPQEMFNKLVPKGSNVIKLSDIEGAKDSVMLELARMVTPPHSHAKPRDEL